jgi:hypothetical protein
MMAGHGQFGPLEMGGMFTVVKVREGLASGDYRDPGHYQHPPGTVAYEWKGESLNPVRAPTSRATEIDPATARGIGRREVEVRVRKPNGHGHR